MKLARELTAETPPLLGLDIKFIEGLLIAFGTPVPALIWSEVVLRLVGSILVIPSVTDCVGDGVEDCPGLLTCRSC